MFHKGDSEPHLAGWHRGKTVYRGIEGEWRAMFRKALEQWAAAPQDRKLAEPGPVVPLANRAGRWTALREAAGCSIRG